MKLPRIALIPLLVLAFVPHAADAALITNTFEATVVNGALAGVTGTGSVTYDDALLIGGDEVLSPLDGLTVSFTFGGQNFDETNDIDFDAFPELGFSGFIPVFLDYILVDGINGVDFNDSTLFSLFMFDLVPNGPNFDFEADLFAVYVPAPGVTWLLGVGLLSLVGFERRRRQR